MPHYLNHFEPDLPSQAFRKGLGKNRPETLEGKGGGAPSSPDPWETAAATQATNRNTASYNKALNLNNFSNPFGSQTSYISGYDSDTGAPIYQTNITGNSDMQYQLNNLLSQTGRSDSINQSALGGLYGLNGQTALIGNQYGGLNSQLAGLQSYLNPQAAQQAQQRGQDAAYKSQTQYLDPQFSQQGESLSASLANQGLTPGSEAYNNAMTNFNNQKQQAYSNAQNQAIMTGSQLGTQNWQNQLAGLSANAGLLGQQASNLGQQGNMVNQQAGLIGQIVGIGQTPYSNLQTIASMIPGYAGPAASAAQPADIAGYLNNQYQGQLAGYNAKNASANATTSALGSLGAAGMLALALSDRRAKTAIRKIGTWMNGLNVYTYRYRGRPERHIGFMADEVKAIRPGAVLMRQDGYEMVNYRLAGA